MDSCKRDLTAWFSRGCHLNTTSAAVAALEALDLGSSSNASDASHNGLCEDRDSDVEQGNDADLEHETESGYGTGLEHYAE